MIQVGNGSGSDTRVKTHCSEQSEAEVCKSRVQLVKASS